MEKRPFLKNLNALRFIAASYTIFFHYWSIPSSTILTGFFKHGHISVPFFFLLSGFVLSYSYSSYDFDEQGNTKKYILNRLIRLGPIYYIAMVLALPLIFISKSYQEVSLAQGIVYMLSHLTFTQSFIPIDRMVNFWNIHSWSLSVEVFLYLISPVFIAKIAKANIKHSCYLLVLTFIINTILFYFTFEPYHLLEITSPFFAPLYLPTFLNGIVIANIFIKIKNQKTLILASQRIFPTVSILLIISFFSNFSDSFYSPFNPIYHIGFSLLILSSAVENRYNKFLGSKLLINLGEASYAMYILQAPIKVATQQTLSKIFGYTQSDGFFYCISVFLAITASAFVLSHYLDPKIRKALSARLIRK